MAKNDDSNMLQSRQEIEIVPAVSGDGSTVWRNPNYCKRPLQYLRFVRAGRTLDASVHA
jgi:hypothetical protein